jgi:hypothetical protein
MDEAIAFFWLKGEGRSLFSVQRGRGDRFFSVSRRGRSLFIFTVRGDRFLSVSRRGRSLFIFTVRGDRFFLSKGEEAIAVFLTEGREAIAFFWLKGEGRSLFSG